MKAIVQITKLPDTQEDCDMCERSLDNDPYQVEFDDGSTILLCDICGENFAKYLNLEVITTGWGKR